MNSFASAALLAQASAAVDSGFMALAMVQGMGVVLAIVLTSYIRKVYTIPDRWHACMLLVVVAVFGVTDGDECLERRLVAEEPILVDLVRADRDIDDVVLDVHPVHVALAVVVAGKGKALSREFLECWLGIKEISLKRSAVHEQMNHALGARGKVGAACGRGIGGGKQMRQSE